MKVAFYIVSLAHCKKSDDYLTLWRPDNAGYCLSRENAGLYADSQEGYHDSATNMPISTDILGNFFIPGQYLGKTKWMVPNHKAVWEILDVEWKRGVLTRKSWK